MRLWKHRPSPAMIVAIVALFVAMGGTGYAVSKVPKRSVGPTQLRKNAVRSQHIKPRAITTRKLAKSTLSALKSGGAATSPGAASGTGASSAGVTQFVTNDTIRWIEPFTIGEGTRDMLKVGPFTLTARCTLDETIGGVAAQDLADIIISTTQARSAFDGDDLLGSLDPGDNIETRQFVNTTTAPTGDPRLEASSDGLAMGGDGVLYIKGSYLFAGQNVANQPGTCRFGGYIFL
jgi:hypothetical protein